MGRLALHKAVVIAGIFLVFNMMIPGSFLSSPQYAAADDPPFCDLPPITLSGDAYREGISMTSSPTGGLLVTDLGADFYSLSTTGSTADIGGTDTIIKGIAFVDGKLYAVAKSGSTLYELNPANGLTIDDTVTITIDGTPISGAAGLASSPTGELVGLLKPGRVLASIDPDTGVATVITTPDEFFAGIAFLPDGTLLGVSGGSSNILEETLYEIDLDDGSVIAICTFGHSDSGEAIAFDFDTCLLYHISGIPFFNQDGEIISDDRVFEAIDPRLSAAGLEYSCVPPPEIFIDKISNVLGLFDFTVTGGSSDITFEINIEEGGPEIFTGAHGPEILEPEIEYTISEVPPTPESSWSTVISCTKNSSSIDTTFTPSDGDIIECLFTNTFSDSGDTKKGMKRAVIKSLTDLKGSDPKTDKEIDKLTRHIDHSLKEKLWENDDTPDSKHGKKIFDEEKKAVKELRKALKKAKEPLAGAISFAIKDLVDIDYWLAQDAIDKAVELSGDMKELDKSDKEMMKAGQEITKGHPDHAIDKFKKAWEHAQHAIKKAS